MNTYYHSLSDELKKQFGEKVYKLSLDAGCTCPNRNGTVGFGGCIFCSEGGSGDFAQKITDINEYTISAQIEAAKAKVASKTSSDKYIAYFQSFTNTYGDIHRLSALYESVISRDDIVALSIGTRPDCLGPDVMEMLIALNAIKPVWIELGLQTINEKTASLIRRGYTLSVFEDAYKRLKEAGITVITHVILGLPGESLDDMRATVRYLAALSPTLDGIKLQLLHVLKNTDLASLYEKGQADIYDFSIDSYVNFVIELLSYLPSDTVVHRITGDGPKSLLIHPLWSANKKAVLNAFNKRFRELYSSDNLANTALTGNPTTLS